MYPENQNIKQLLYLVTHSDICHAVITPGARNAPLSHAFANCPSLQCHRIIDERSAGFYALGIAEATNKSVIVCCTSGSAVLNLAPAVAEASLRRIPLLLITADRPKSMIGQLEGQTIEQENIFNPWVEKSVSLPLGDDKNSHQFSNRLLNEAFIALSYKSGLPVHINIPLDEPLFNFSSLKIPQVRKITSLPYKTIAEAAPVKESWRKAKKKLIVIGQHKPDSTLYKALQQLKKNEHCVIFSELISNLPSHLSVFNFDLLINTLSEETLQSLTPDLIISLGGHIVSKEIKKWLRNCNVDHWHISPHQEFPDLFWQMSTSIHSDVVPFLEQLSAFSDENQNPAATDFEQQWHYLSSLIPPPGYSQSRKKELHDLYVVERLLNKTPTNICFHVGNSSSIRNLQLFPGKAKYYFCNRGVSGIEGSLSTAIGHAKTNPMNHLLLIGDLSFFYDMTALAIENIPAKLKIVVINNNGGAIFHRLEGLSHSNALEKFIAHHHNHSIEGWVKSCGWNYLSANDTDQLDSSLTQLFSQENIKPTIVEVFTKIEESTTALKSYIRQTKELLSRNPSPKLKNRTEKD